MKQIPGTYALIILKIPKHSTFQETFLLKLDGIIHKIASKIIYFMPWYLTTCVVKKLKVCVNIRVYKLPYLNK